MREKKEETVYTLCNPDFVQAPEATENEQLYNKHNFSE